MWDNFFDLATTPDVVLPLLVTITIISGTAVLVGYGLYHAWMSGQRDRQKAKQQDAALKAEYQKNMTTQKQRLEHFTRTGELPPSPLDRIGRGSNIAYQFDLADIERLAAGYDFKLLVNPERGQLAVRDLRRSKLSRRKRLQKLEYSMLLFATPQQWRREFKRLRYSVFNRRAKRAAAVAA